MADAERELAGLRAANAKLQERVAELERALAATAGGRPDDRLGASAPSPARGRAAGDSEGTVPEHRRAALALRESEALVRSIGNNLPNAMLYQVFRFADGTRKFTYVSGSVRRLHGCTPAQAMADPGRIYGQLPDDDRQRVIAEEEAAHKAFRPFSTQTRIRTASGDLRWSYFASAPRRLEDGATCWDGIEVDITDRKRGEEEREALRAQLQQSSKMESLGRLGGGIAHDLNNLLTPILGYGETLVDDFSKDDARRADLEVIVRAGRRARALVHQLLAFSRKQALELRHVDLNRIITDFGRLLRRTIREDVKILYDLAPSLPGVYADVVQIEQVLMNLAVNAQDAMPRGGLLSISTRHESPPGDDGAGPAGGLTGDRVVLTVRDNGQGMDPETREHLFEPFFTTKGGTKGTGLGLATVYGIVTQHGGTIRAHSEPGQGALFTMALPAAGPVVEEERTSVDVASLDAGWETVLLVEDDEAVRTLAGSILSRQGYRLLVAGNGPDALALLDRYEGPLHLLLTDVVMPEMNGKDLYGQVLLRRPGLRAVFMSGYATEVIAPHGVMDEGLPFIQKPFTGRALAAKVRAVLDGAPPTPVASVSEGR